MKSSSALLVVDVQQAEFAGLNPVRHPKALLANIRLLIENCRKAGRPVIYLQHDGLKGTPYEPETRGWQIHPSIKPEKDDLVIRKRHSDCFYETDLNQRLSAMKVNRLVVAGIRTEVCVDTACRRAYSLGYKVVLAKDAHGTSDSPPLRAEEIIEHHNRILGDWFAKLEESRKVQF
jgi:nicotinamidase-related amidase